MGALGHFVSMTATFLAAVALASRPGGSDPDRGEEIDYSRARLASTGGNRATRRGCANWPKITSC